MSDVDAAARIRPIYGVVALAVLLLSLRAEASCPNGPPVPPSVSLVYVGVTPTGTATFTLTYSFPEPTLTSKQLIWTRDGGSSHHVGIDSSGSGEVTIQSSVDCIPPGNHTWTAYATASCGAATTSSASATASFDNTPTVALSIGAPVNGRVSGTLTYDFPNTFTQAERQLWLEINGAVYPQYSLDRQGDRAFTIPVACWPTGTYPVIAYAKACSLTDPEAVATDSGSITINTMPTVSISYAGPDANGNGIVTIDYGFTDIFANADQQLWLEIDGAFAGWGPSSVRSGTWTFPLARGCWSTLTARARACRTADPGYNASDTFSLPSKPTVDVSLAKLGKDPATGNRIIKVQTLYDVKKTGAQVKIDLLKWIDAGGQVHAGGTLRQFTPSPLSGTDAFTFTAPTSARQLIVRATVVGACEVVTDIAAIECDPCDNASANPVYYSDGNVKVDDADPLPTVNEWSLARSYDSDEQAGGLFGRGWTTLFDRRVIVDVDTVSVTTETNEVVVFEEVQGVFRQAWPTNRISGTLLYDSGAGTYTYRAGGSTVEAVFRASDGRVMTLRNRVGVGEAVIAYDTLGQPATFSDTTTGVTWNFTVDAQRHVTAIGVTGHPDLGWSYAYDSAGNLITVTAPGSSPWRTYEYVDNRMIESRDALGNLIESHTYNADGFGISSTGDVDEIATLEYNLPGAVPEERVTLITYKNGAQATYALRPIGGAMRPVLISGGCSSCGASEATFVRDQNGRVVLHQGGDGYVTRTLYAGDRMQSQESPLKPAGCDPASDSQRCRMSTDALAVAELETTSATATTTYSYDDPLWPDRTTEAKRPSVRVPGQFQRESYVYHPSTGAVLSRTVCGWETINNSPVEDCRLSVTTMYESGVAPQFDPGGVFLTAWLALPQPHLPKQVDGPRTDVTDVTSFVYYPIDATVPGHLRGHLAAMKNSAGHITRYEDYDVFGDVARVVDANGVATEMTYDALGRPKTSTIKAVPGCSTAADPLCATDVTTTRTYEPSSGPIARETRAGGGVIGYTYDTRGRLQTISRGQGATDLRERMETSYDALTGKKSLERMLAYENGSWVEKSRQSFAYDSQSRLQTVTHADGAAIHYTYDPEDRIATIQDENHTAPNTTYAYDAAGRVSSVKQTLAGAANGVISTSYAYDINGNLTAVTDPNGNVTSCTYDDFGQMRSQVSPVTGSTTYSYDAAGNLKQTTDANGATTARAYDQLNRVTSATSTLAPATEVVAWTYDHAAADRFGIGRVASMSDPSGSTEYRYERRGLLRDETRTLTGAQYTYTTGFQYDADGNRTVVQYPSTQLTVEYGFDWAGRPTSASGVVSSAKYLPFGPLSSFFYANGRMSSRVHDSRYRLTLNGLIGLASPANILLAVYTYEYDAVGNITSISDTLDSSFDRTFEYDDLNRLTAANTGSSLWRRGNYTWDAMGNLVSVKLGEIEKGPTDPLDEARPPRSRLRMQENIPLGRSSSFVYAGTTPRIAEATTNDLSRFVTYDAAGNETSYVATRTYSPRNLLAQVTDPVEPGDPLQHKIEYTYDGRGIRVARAESPADGPNTTARRFSIYTPELQLMAVTQDDASNVWAFSAADKNIRYEIVWFAGVPVAQITPGGPTLYTFTDHLGTPILQMDATTTIVWQAEHEPFGNVYEMRTGKRTDQPLRFPGQEVAMNWEGQEENYNIFRWYRTGWGRYTQADPLGEPRSKEPNLYAYVAGRPIVQIDPFGLFKIDKSCDCAGGQYGNVAKGVAQMCSYLQKPKCAALLNKFSFLPYDGNSSEPLGQCLKKRCSSEHPIYCAKNTDKQYPTACGKTSPPSGAITLMTGAGTGQCYFEQGVGWAPVILHEAIHSCGLVQESYGNSPYSKVFQKIMWTCAGVLD